MKTKKNTSAVSSIDRSILNFFKMRVTVHSFSVVFPAIDYWPVTPPVATEGRRDDNTYSLDFKLISASTSSCTEAAVRTGGLGCTSNVKKPLIEEDAGMSMLARTRLFLVKFFLLLTSREPNDRVRDQSATEGDSQVPDCPLDMYLHTRTIY